MKVREPKLGETVLYRHQKSRDPAAGYFKSPAVITEIGERGEIDLLVLSTRIGVVERKNVKEGSLIGQWEFRD